MPTQVFITVFVGAPIDWSKYRHTALFFAFPDGSTDMLHVGGGHGFFAFENRPGYNPVLSKTLANKIPVAGINDSVSTAAIKATVMATPINNTDPEWNCQNWVGEALTRMVNAGYFPPAERTRAFDEMIDACMEAKDEQW